MNHTQKFWEQIQQLWQATTGSPDICIAVIDGEVDMEHSCFEGAIFTQNLLNSKAAGLPTEHGTHVASIIFGQHHSEIRGVAPQCKGLSVPIFHLNSKGELKLSNQAKLARAITKAVDLGAKIINVSAGEFSKSGESGGHLEQAIEHCKKHQVLIISATGNNGCACVHVPASNPQVLAVGAINDDGIPMDFSNWGENYQLNGVLAPGNSIEGAIPGENTQAKTGTSFATPLISGLIGLLLSLQKQQGQTPDVYQVKNALLHTAIPCDTDNPQHCARFLNGIVDIQAALEYLKLDIPGNVSSSDANRLPTTATLKSQNSINMSELNQQVPSASEGSLVEASEANVVPQENTGAALPVANVTPNELPEATAAAVIPAASPVAATAITPNQVSPNQVSPSEVTPSCACETGDLVFALGSLWVDYPTQAILDSFKFYMRGIYDDEGKEIKYPNPYNPVHLLNYLNGQKGPGNGSPDVSPHHYDSNRLVWILRQEEMPIYAIQPDQAFAADAYALLRDFLQPFDSEDGKKQAIDMVSIPGRIVGETKLYSGEVVPVIEPNMRAMHNWRSRDLVAAVSVAHEYAVKDTDADKKPMTPEDKKRYEESLENLINRLYYEFRNLGTTSAERALNYTGTNVFGFGEIVQQMITEDYALQSISAEKSPVCRPDSDCQDVTLRFFKPNERLRTSSRVFRYTVDVSKVIPVPIGQPRTWFEY